MTLQLAAQPKKRGAILESAAAFGTVGIILMLIIPLPPFLLDMLLSLNIALAVGVLMVTFYVKRPLDFSSFPSMLLLVTLFRLALNISATRLILGFGSAGSVIGAFGTFVVGGNFVVGIVVFAVLVVIQFVVITSGASRVAEVSARFTLDAMPGKQMAIDAELNSGGIDEETARRRRKEVGQEADFYGAMDGASKFVRGDAIAAVVMMVINILGGILIGVLQRGMDIPSAIQTYSMLTIGEGLVTQMPALLISASAGLLVTRTAGESSLGSQLGGQLLAHPQAVLVASGAVAVLAFTPGLPAVPFLLLAGGMAAFGNRLKQQAAAPKAIAAPAAKPPENIAELLSIDPVEIELGYALVCLADPKQGGDLLDRVTAARRQIATDLGIVVPPIRVRDNVRLKGNQYVVRLRGLELASSELLPGHVMALDGGGVRQPITGAKAQDPAFGLPAVWVPAGQRSLAEVSGYTVVDPTNVLITHLTELLRRYADELLTRQEVQSLLDKVKQKAPAVVDELIPGQLTLGHVQKALQLLLRERVSVRDLSTILEALADAAPTSHDPEVLTEYVRHRLARQLTRQYVSADNRLYCFTLEPAVESAIADAIRKTEAGTQVVLDAPQQQRLLGQFRTLSERMIGAGRQPIVICSSRARLGARYLAERTAGALVALSYGEIAAGAAVESVGMVNWSNDENTAI